MTYIHSRSKRGMLITHSRGEGTYPKDEPCPDEYTYKEFMRRRKGYLDAGAPVPSIRECLPERYPDGPLRTSVPERVHTLTEWLGTPDAPGPFWTHNAAMSGKPTPRPERRHAVGQVLTWLGPDVAGKPLTAITVADIQAAYDRLLVCMACSERAKAEGRDDLLRAPAEFLSAARDPWDGTCGGETEYTHHPYLCDSTIMEYRRDASLVFRVAKWAGAEPDPIDDRCSPRQTNPVERLSLRDHIGKPSPLQYARAHTHSEVAQLDGVMPESLQSIVLTHTYGMLRRGELLGLNRYDFGRPDPDTEAELHLQRVINSTNKISPRGKNRRALGSKVLIPATVTAAIAHHIAQYRSTPDPDNCEACRDGLREHDGTLTTNPHKGCDFAASAPMWTNPRTGKRLSYATYGRLFAQGVQAVGLDRDGFVPKSHSLRATGATYLLQKGVSPETVMALGRWSDLRTVLRHYYRPTKGPQTDAVRMLDLDIRAAANLSGASDSVTGNESLRARLDAVEAENQKLRAAGAKPAQVDVPLPKPRFHADDVRRELPHARNETDLCIRLGTTGQPNTRTRLRRLIAEEGLTPPWAA